MLEGRNSDSPIPRRRLYGRSRGKALRPGQVRLLKEALPRVAIAPGALVASSLFPFEPRELWLEIGFGSGEHLIAQAKSNPEIGFIGCEPFLNGVAAALSGIERENLINVRIRRGDVQTLFEGAPEGVFSRVFLLYPDPWPKRRHNKRRVVSEPIIEALARTLRPGGELRFATDVDDYAGWTLRRFLASPSFRWTAARAADWRTPWPEWRPTRYEAKAQKAGRGSVYLNFVRL
ncbi:MAG: tRNA (guanosine(46)-N7)-methyltransferase TrmB [Hyphomicrobiales bacterium]|nr:tRNA (guanosine(46)-N7)-methyltransferase TrmB [Hyphomicrobiales bacterium]MBV8441650.1 tRNA (guanosine(46)-N7)-methyltransferase TrmB [Hyphomicrobiales bacterium]